MSAISRALRPLALLVVALATVVATLAMTTSAEAATRTQKATRAAQIAVNQIGDWYGYGAAGPNRFDCSGLMYYSARRAGFSHMPRTSSAQARFTKRIKKSRLRKGDYMFFTGSGGVYHAAMFLKWNKRGQAVMVHSPRSGERVQRAVPWTSSWFAGTLR